MLDIDKNKCILDLGCGNGHLANYLINAGFNVYGTDASKKGIAIARNKHPDRFFVQDLSTGDIPKELKDLKFDTIISTEVIEHLYNPQLFVELCGQILSSSKGELILSTPYHGYLKNLLLSILNKWDRHMNPLWLGGHIKMWSPNTLSQILKINNFKMIAFKGCGRVPYLWMSMVIKSQLQ